MAADVFSAYHESGWQHPDKIAKVSRNITNVLLSAGSAVPMGEVFRSLRGRDPNPEALMLSLGEYQFECTSTTFNLPKVFALPICFSYCICQLTQLFA